MLSTEQLQKVRLRTEFMIMRRGLDSAAAHTHSLAAQRALLADPAWRNARQVTLYMPIRKEMDTAILLEDAWDRQVQVLLPRCHSHEQGAMDFVPCASHAQLTAGPYGILEPSPDCPALPWDVAQLLPDVAVIPALVFDAAGFRVGYGGGYYDRALRHPCFARTRTVGLCYAAQCVSVVPRQAWDCPVNALCTEEGLQWL